LVTFKVQTSDGKAGLGSLHPIDTSPLLTVSDTASGQVGGATSGAIATRLAVSAPSSVGAGTSAVLTVTALDGGGHTVSGYSGTVHFTSSDGVAVLPFDAQLKNGVGTFSAVLKTAGAQTITATDTVSQSLTGTSGAISVGAGPATHFSVTAPPSGTAGSGLSLMVKALDQFGNTATGYNGTVHFTSSDGVANLPADSPLSSGAGTFTETPTVVGGQTVTATDTATSSITGTSAPISVGAGSTASSP
jgi:hypothetical protein